jgi:hypothetical protein
VGVSSEIVAKAIVTIMEKAAKGANSNRDGYPFDIRFHAGRNSRTQDVIYVKSVPKVMEVEKEKEGETKVKKKKQTMRRKKQ